MAFTIQNLLDKIEREKIDKSLPIHIQGFSIEEEDVTTPCYQDKPFSLDMTSHAQCFDRDY